MTISFLLPHEMAVTAKPSFHKPAIAEHFSTCSQIQAYRLPDISCNHYLKVYNGLKTSAGIDLTGVCKTNTLKVAPQGLHLETAAVTSTCERGNKMQIDFSFNVFGLTSVFIVKSEAASAWKGSHR